MLIVGLGNPDAQFNNTFHNVGFMVADRLAELYGVQIKKRECRSLTCKPASKDNRLMLAKPQTYMNLSGMAVQALTTKFSYKLPECIVIFDTIDLPRGKTRIRTHGSGGTHNGMRSIVNCCGESFVRISVGIGRSDNLQMELKDYVLSHMDENCYAQIKAAVDKVACALKEYLECGDFDRLTRTINTND